MTVLVIELTWNADGEVRRETYGPWAPADDLSHLAGIAEFMAGWRERTGIEPLSATMTALVDPAAWLQGNVTVTAASVPGEG